MGSVVKQWKLGQTAAKADWPRYATALLSAPVFGVLFWLFGFVIASLAAMLLMPLLMGYQNRRQLVVVAVVTVRMAASARTAPTDSPTTSKSRCHRARPSTHSAPPSPPSAPCGDIAAP